MALPDELITAFNKYIVRKQIGQGGAGRVLLVEDSEGRQFAAKLLHKESITEERVSRFRNEILFCSGAAKPGIAQVLDFGFIEMDGRRIPFSVMPLYPLSLRSLMKSSLTPKRSFEIFNGILSSVALAHQNGIIHRDIKPENILFSENDGVPILGDFGIAHFESVHNVGGVVTSEGSRMANFRYAAPEQRRNDQVDGRADLYAIGQIAIELFTGAVPYGVGYRRIGQAVPEFAWLDAITERLIQDDVQQRTSSAVEAIRQIEAAKSLALLAPTKADDTARSAQTEKTGALAGSLASVASKIASDFKYQERRRVLRNRIETVDLARESTIEIFSLMEEMANEISTGTELRLKAFRDGSNVEISANGYSVSASWQPQFSNSIDGAVLRVSTWRGPAAISGRQFFEQPQRLSTVEYEPDVDRGDGIIWRPRGSVSDASESDIANYCLSKLFESINSSMIDR